MSGFMGNVDKNLAVVGQTLPQIQNTLFVLNENILVMPALSQSAGCMDTNLGSLDVDRHSLVGEIGHMNGNVANMMTSLLK